MTNEIGRAAEASGGGRGPESVLSPARPMRLRIQVRAANPSSTAKAVLIALLEEAIRASCGRLHLWLLLAAALGGQQQYVVEGQCLVAAVINQDA